MQFEFHWVYVACGGGLAKGCCGKNAVKCFPDAMHILFVSYPQVINRMVYMRGFRVIMRKPLTMVGYFRIPRGKMTKLGAEHGEKCAR